MVHDSCSRRKVYSSGLTKLIVIYGSKVMIYCSITVYGISYVFFNVGGIVPHPFEQNWKKNLDTAGG